MPKRILIHDDEPHTLEYHARILRDHGYALDFIDDQKTAFKLMNGDAGIGQCDLLILDMLMPVPDPKLAVEVEQGNRTGRWFLREYRKNCGDGVPVLLFSRLDLDELTVAGWQAYQSWRQQVQGAEKQDETLQSTMQKKLIDRFKVWVRAKNDTPPSDMPDVVKGIIGSP